MDVNAYLILSALLFTIGTVGVILKRNVISVLLCIEIMLNAANLSFIAFARYLGQVHGQIFVFFVMVVAAAEAAVGLAIAIVLFRNRGTLSVDETDLLKW
jgi:NADH-quinone oxidoreductase subunit K